MSWVLGVTLGLLAGLILLIATPIMLRKAAPATAAASTAATATTTPAPAASTPAKTETAKTETAKTETPAASSEKTAAGNADAGKALYTTSCAACHGANGQGGIGLPLNKADGPIAWTEAQFASAVRDGKAPTRDLLPTMPRQPQMTDTQLADLHAFIKTLK